MPGRTKRLIALLDKMIPPWISALTALAAFIISIRPQKKACFETALAPEVLYTAKEDTKVDVYIRGHTKSRIIEVQPIVDGDPGQRYYAEDTTGPSPMLQTDFTFFVKKGQSWKVRIHKGSPERAPSGEGGGLPIIITSVSGCF